MKISSPQPTSPTTPSDEPAPVPDAPTASEPAAGPAGAELGSAAPVQGAGDDEPSAPGRILGAPGRPWTLALVALVVLVALVETTAALWPQSLHEDDLHAACAALRAEFRPGDLITLAPAWLTQLGQRELGDLMPVTMLGRPDARRYSRIWTVSFGPAAANGRAAELAGLTASVQRDFGKVKLARYEQTPVTVTYDLTAQLLSAQVAEAAVGGSAAAAPPPPEVPCLWSGPVPTPRPARGGPPERSAARARPSSGGSWRSTTSRVTAWWRRSPRVSGPSSSTPASPTSTGKVASSPCGLACTTITRARPRSVRPRSWSSLDHGARVTLPVTVAQGFELHELTLPAGHSPTHTIRLEISAASAANHFVGLHGELRR